MLFLIANTVLLTVFVGLLFYLNSRKKHLEHRRQYTLILITAFSFSFLWEVVFLLLLPAPDVIVQKIPTLFMFGDSTNNWIGIWLAIIDIIVSIITALAALLISFKQDDLVKFEFETSLIPLFQADGFCSKFLSPNDAKMWEFYKTIVPQDMDFKNHGGIFLLDFGLKSELNPNMEYVVESLDVYCGMLSKDKINKDVAIASLSKNDNSVFLESKQKNGSFVLESQIVIEDRGIFSDEFNVFLCDLETPEFSENSSSYTLLFNITLSSRSTKYVMNKRMKLLINLVNEAALFRDRNKDNVYKIYSASHEFEI